jgi:seryl-tRNA synthetase
VFKATKNKVKKERPRNQKKNCWFSKETIDLIEQRRELKVKGLHYTSQYNQLSTQIRREIRRDKNQIIIERCKKIEAYADKIYTRELFQEIKKLTGDFKLKKSAIKDENGKVHTKPRSILEC